jgi:hypothetical protein
LCWVYFWKFVIIFFDAKKGIIGNVGISWRKVWISFWREGERGLNDNFSNNLVDNSREKNRKS